MVYVVNWNAKRNRIGEIRRLIVDGTFTVKQEGIGDITTGIPTSEL